MSTSTHAAQPQERLSSKQTRKVVTAGCVGIFVELYDNGIFAFMAGTLALVFLAPGNPDNALLFVFAGYAVSFFVRPLGPWSAATWGTGSDGKNYWSLSSC